MADQRLEEMREALLNPQVNLGGFNGVTVLRTGYKEAVERVFVYITALTKRAEAAEALIAVLDSDGHINIGACFPCTDYLVAYEQAKDEWEKVW